MLVRNATENIETIKTKYGEFICRGGHGRLKWRAETFHTEEPETVLWLNTIGKNDVYWDVGANVGLYAIYVALFKNCEVIAFEPESQNYALLLENIELNKANVLASAIALSGCEKFGRLKVKEFTKGGAYNTFGQEGRQIVYGASIDELVYRHGFKAPTQLKIDVDGNEEEIICGANRVLDAVKSVMIEINHDDSIRDNLLSRGFKILSDVPCARNETARNVIFGRFE